MSDSKRIVSNLNKLTQLELDVIEAYSSVIDKIESARSRHRLSQIRSDHQRHVHLLGVEVTRLGGPRLHYASLFRHVIKAQVAVACRVGGDTAMLTALRLWKGLTILRYQIALRWGRLPSELKQVLASNLEDERRHYAWLSDENSANERTA